MKPYIKIRKAFTHTLEDTWTWRVILWFNEETRSHLQLVSSREFETKEAAANDCDKKLENLELNGTPIDKT